MDESWIKKVKEKRIVQYKQGIIYVSFSWEQLFLSS